jgi:sec-independent protein translocase protein TatA
MRFGSLGPTELILIVLAIVLIFGASKLVDIGGALGKSIKEFKKASKDEESEAAAAKEAAQQQPTAQPEAAPAPTVVVNGAVAEKSTPVVAGDYRPPDAQSN